MISRELWLGTQAKEEIAAVLHPSPCMRDGYFPQGVCLYDANSVCDTPTDGEGAGLTTGSPFCTRPDCPEIIARGAEEITGQPVFCKKYKRLKIYRR